MSRIFDAMKKAQASREAIPPVTPLATAPNPFARAAQPARPALPLIGAADVSEDVVRAMSALRVNIEGTLGERPSRTVLFLAPQGGEGTSTVALQFAQALARDRGARPLLIDCHARRPAYELQEGGRCVVLDPRLAPGGPEQAPVVASNLFVVPVADEVRQAGMMPATHLRDLLEAYGPGYDWVILDAPPVLDSPDAAALAAVADGLVLVLQAGRTKRPVMTRTAELLAKSGARLLGTVLNRRVLEIPDFIYRRI